MRFTKLSDVEHEVVVVRDDGSTETARLDSRSFLRHDLAHWAVEAACGLRDGVWGSVAAGGSLGGPGLDGRDMAVAESLAGPMQTLMRTDAGPDEILAVLERIVPDLASADLAGRVHELVRRLRGHWNATAYGEAMTLRWPPEDVT